ncbi:replicative DNA helicase [Megasphaera sp. UPII 135-E]|nr:replicative DNA helicase [Megasphaera sp. UPII 135-E]
MDQRIPPQNVEAEQAVLGAMMLEKDAVITALEKLRARDFYRDTHKIIFTAMERLYKNQQEVDIITLPEELRKMKKLDDVGGLEYILSLPNVVATAANLSYHANIVREKALSRDLISTCTELSVEAYSGEKGTEELMDQAEQKF